LLSLRSGIHLFVVNLSWENAYLRISVYNMFELQEALDTVQTDPEAALLCLRQFLAGFRTGDYVRTLTLLDLKAMAQILTGLLNDWPTEDETDPLCKRVGDTIIELFNVLGDKYPRSEQLDITEVRFTVGVGIGDFHLRCKKFSISAHYFNYAWSLCEVMDSSAAAEELRLAISKRICLVEASFLHTKLSVISNQLLLLRQSVYYCSVVKTVERIADIFYYCDDPVLASECYRFCEEKLKIIPADSLSSKDKHLTGIRERLALVEKGAPSSYYPQFQTYKHLLQQIRQSVKEKPNLREQIDEMNVGLTQLVRSMIDEVVSALGPPPVEFTIVSFGSMSREEACPYSDVECGIIMKDWTQSDQYLEYFTCLADYLEFKFLSLGEDNRLIASMRCGLRLDCCYSPAGSAKSMYSIDLLRQRFNSLEQVERNSFTEASYLHGDPDVYLEFKAMLQEKLLEEEYHKTFALELIRDHWHAKSKQRYMFGRMQSDTMSSAGPQPGSATSISEARKRMVPRTAPLAIIHNDQDPVRNSSASANDGMITRRSSSGSRSSFQNQHLYSRPETFVLNVKEQFLRFPILILHSLCLYFNVEGTNSFDRIKNLIQRGHMNRSVGAAFEKIVTVGFKLRYQLHFHCKSEQDMVDLCGHNGKYFEDFDSVGDFVATEKDIVAGQHLLLFITELLKLFASRFLGVDSASNTSPPKTPAPSSSLRTDTPPPEACEDAFYNLSALENESISKYYLCLFEEEYMDSRSAAETASLHTHHIRVGHRHLWTAYDCSVVAVEDYFRGIVISKYFDQDCPEEQAGVDGLWHPKGDLMRTVNCSSGSYHVVGDEMLLKFHCASPGIEYAAANLANMVTGLAAATCVAGRLLLPNGAETMDSGHDDVNETLVMSSFVMKGKRLDEILKSEATALSGTYIDSESYSNQFIRALLVGPNNDSASKFLVVETESEYGEVLRKLLVVDNEGCFNYVDKSCRDSVVGADIGCTAASVCGGTLISILTKSIILCSDRMHDPIHPHTADRVVGLELDGLIHRWLELLKVFESTCSGANVRLPTDIAVVLYQKLRLLKDVLCEDRTLSHWEILRRVDPVLFVAYSELFTANLDQPVSVSQYACCTVLQDRRMNTRDANANESAAERRFDLLASHAFHLINTMKQGHANNCLLQSAFRHMPSALEVADENDRVQAYLGLRTIQLLDCFAQFQHYRSDYQRVQDVRNGLLARNMSESYLSAELTPQMRQEVMFGGTLPNGAFIGGIDFGSLPDRKQYFLLGLLTTPLAVSHGSSASSMFETLKRERQEFIIINLSNCSVLTSSVLVDILRHSQAELQYLNISNCPKVTMRDFMCEIEPILRNDCKKLVCCQHSYSLSTNSDMFREMITSLDTEKNHVDEISRPASKLAATRPVSTDQASTIDTLSSWIKSPFRNRSQSFSTRPNSIDSGSGKLPDDIDCIAYRQATETKKYLNLALKIVTETVVVDVLIDRLWKTVITLINFPMSNDDAKVVCIGDSITRSSSKAVISLRIEIWALAINLLCLLVSLHKLYRNREDDIVPVLIIALNSSRYWQLHNGNSSAGTAKNSVDSIDDTTATILASSHHFAFDSLRMLLKNHARKLNKRTMIRLTDLLLDTYEQQPYVLDLSMCGCLRTVLAELKRWHIKETAVTPVAEPIKSSISNVSSLSLNPSVSPTDEDDGNHSPSDNSGWRIRPQEKLLLNRIVSFMASSVIGSKAARVAPFIKRQVTKASCIIVQNFRDALDSEQLVLALMVIAWHSFLEDFVAAEGKPTASPASRSPTSPHKSSAKASSTFLSNTEIDDLRYLGMSTIVQIMERLCHADPASESPSSAQQKQMQADRRNSAIIAAINSVAKSTSSSSASFTKNFKMVESSGILLGLLLSTAKRNPGCDNWVRLHGSSVVSILSHVLRTFGERSNNFTFSGNVSASKFEVSCVYIVLQGLFAWPELIQEAGNTILPCMTALVKNMSSTWMLLEQHHMNSHSAGHTTQSLVPIGLEVLTMQVCCLLLPAAVQEVNDDGNALVLSLMKHWEDDCFTRTLLDSTESQQLLVIRLATISLKNYPAVFFGDGSHSAVACSSPDDDEAYSEALGSVATVLDRLANGAKAGTSLTVRLEALLVIRLHIYGNTRSTSSPTSAGRQQTGVGFSRYDSLDSSDAELVEVDARVQELILDKLLSDQTGEVFIALDWAVKWLCTVPMRPHEEEAFVEPIAFTLLGIISSNVNRSRVHALQVLSIINLRCRAPVVTVVEKVIDLLELRDLDLVREGAWLYELLQNNDLAVLRQLPTSSLEEAARQLCTHCVTLIGMMGPDMVDNSADSMDQIVATLRVLVTLLTAVRDAAILSDDNDKELINCLIEDSGRYLT
jgi:hypothetical protein